MGRLEHFEDFEYKLKACFLELGLDEITFKPYADVLAARDKLIKAVELTVRQSPRLESEEAADLAKSDHS